MRVSILILTLALAGCATYRPLVDRPGPQFEQDLAECQRIAEGEPGAGTGAVVGAVLGLAAGAFLGKDTGVAGKVTRMMTVAGALGGAAGGAERNADIVNNCLRGRGYSVLR